MLGLFGTLNLASRSLQTQMTGVEVAGQNLANVNNPAYSRQRVVLQTSADIQTGVGTEGTGVNVQTIEQVVDKLLNGQIVSQATSTGYWNQMQSSLQTAQSSLGEFLNSTQSSASSSSTSGVSSSSGLNDQLSSFFNALQSLAAAPTSISARQNLIAQAQTLATTFNQISSRFGSLKNALNASLNDQVDSANQLLKDVASLNDEIANTENASGGVANDLRDLRQQKLEQLAKYMNFQTSAGTNGAVNISVDNGAFALVTGNQTTSLLQSADYWNTGTYTIWTTNGNNQVTPVGGSMGSLIDARDNTLATMANEVNSLASNLISQINAVHASGYNLSGGNGNPNFFVGANASDIAVSGTIAGDPSLIQASGSATNTGDNSVALSLANLAGSAQAGLNNLSFGDYYSRTVSKLGSALSNANTQADNQKAVADLLSNQRSTVSGVNLDEEMTSLMEYQRAYQASAHVVTTVDQLIQTILSMGA